MSLTFQTLITHNRRTSLGLIAGMVVLISTMCGALAIVASPASEEYLPELFFTGAAFGAALSGFGAVVSYFFGHKIVALMSDARRIEKADDPILYNVIEEMAIAAGLPVPQVYVIFDEAPNAFASGRDPQHALVGITTGLRKKLNRDELQAVIAHEMAHIKNYDIRLMMLVAVFAGIVVLVADFFFRNAFSGFGRRRSAPRTSSGDKGSPLTLVFFILALVFVWFAPTIARLMRLAVSREREYLADATAIQLCRNPTALISALKKIATDPADLHSDNRATEHLFIINPDPKLKLQPDRDSIWSTHPPLIKRISRLRDLAGEMELPVE